MFHEELANQAAALYLNGQASSPKEAVESVISGQGLSFEKISRVCEKTNRTILKKKVSSEAGPLWRAQFETVKADAFKPASQETAPMTKKSSALVDATFDWDRPPQYVPHELVKISHSESSDAFEEAFSAVSEESTDTDDWIEAVQSARLYLQSKQSMLRDVDEQIRAYEFDVEQALSDVCMEIDRAANQELADRIGEKNARNTKLSGADSMSYTAPLYVVSSAVDESLIEPFVDRYAEHVDPSELSRLSGQVIDDETPLFQKASSYNDAVTELIALREVKLDLIEEREEATRMLDKAYQALEAKGIPRNRVY